jgi:membrane protein YdbS with pleckstrin-like domain
MGVACLTTRMDTAHVDRGTISVWRWQGVLATLILAVGACGLVFRFGAPGLYAPLFIVTVGLTLSWIWPAAYYRRLRFGIDETGIAIERGIVWRSRIAVPRVRIQHTDVSQGPLQRRFGVGTLKLYTAGSRYTEIELAGLAHAEAIALRDALLARSDESGV